MHCQNHIKFYTYLKPVANWCTGSLFSIFLCVRRKWSILSEK